MQADRVRIPIPESHKVSFKVPTEVPTGEAEVIMLTDPSVGGTVPDKMNFESRFCQNRSLGPIMLHEDPTTPVLRETIPFVIW